MPSVTAGKLSSKPTGHGLYQSQEQLLSTEDFTHTHTHTHTHAHTICFSGCVLAAYEGFPDGLVVKKPPASIGGAGLIPGSERVPGEGNGNPI